MFALYNPKVDLNFKPILTSAKIVAMNANLSLSDEPLEFVIPPATTVNRAQIVEIEKEKIPLESASHSLTDKYPTPKQSSDIVDVYEERQECSSPVIRLNVTRFANQYLHPFHEQNKQRMQVDLENKLAAESRQIYCELTNLKKNPAILLSQTNGILAAASLELPICSRLKGLGQTVLLQHAPQNKLIFRP